MPDYKISVHGTYSPELSWSFGARLTSSSLIGDVQALVANTWELAWNDPTNGLNQFYPVGTRMEYTRVAQLDAKMKEIQNKTTPASHPGTATGDTLPFLNSTLVSQRTDFSAKWDRGRFYLPAMEETFVNNNVLIDAAGTKIQLNMDAAFNALTAGGNTIFVTSLKRHKGDVDDSNLYKHEIVTKWKVAKKPARQSRRVKKQINTYFG